MWLTIILASVSFLGMFAIVGMGYLQMEKERNAKSEAVFDQAPTARPGHCLLCDAPLRRRSTADEVVVEIEHRIGTELQDVVQLLGQTTPEGFQRLYQA
jgi:hypothetical protein